MLPYTPVHKNIKYKNIRKYTVDYILLYEVHDIHFCVSVYDEVPYIRVPVLDYSILVFYILD